METRVDEIAERIYRISTYIPTAGPGLAFNQFLVDAEEPLLFHTGFRSLFPAVSAAVARVVAPERLRWISFSHLEADESGSMNEWLAIAPRAEILHGPIGVLVSLNDLSDRPPRILADGEGLDLGGDRRIRMLQTPHVPHGWDAIMLFEEETRTLFATDLFTQFGPSAISTAGDIVGPAIAAEDAFPALAVTPTTAPTMLRLAALGAQTLALMHAPAYHGSCGDALASLAQSFAIRLETMRSPAPTT
jgi:flavorubredoxin